MIFSELYGCYYNAVAAIINSACRHPATKADLDAISNSAAFAESFLTITPALTDGRWPLLQPDGSPVLHHPASMPLTLLQKRWLKAIAADPRIRLFDFDMTGLQDVIPLFRPEDICLFDQYADGDPYQDEAYIANFHQILDAIKQRRPLAVTVTNRHVGLSRTAIMPEYLEYSEKDDKFRLFTSGCRYGRVINLGRIVKCQPAPDLSHRYPPKSPPASNCSVTVKLYDSRQALPRFMLHFAHFEKEALRLDDRHYRITIKYHKDDETELVIRILSFGPMVKVTAPKSFVALIKDRLQRQISCQLG